MCVCVCVARVILLLAAVGLSISLLLALAGSLKVAHIVVLALVSKQCARGTSQPPQNDHCAAPSVNPRMHSVQLTRSLVLRAQTRVAVEQLLSGAISSAIERRASGTVTTCTLDCMLMTDWQAQGLLC